MICMCGCGGEAGIATRNDKRSGTVKGTPNRFILRHSGRMGMRYKSGPMYEVLPDGCWKWTFGIDSKGYGQLNSQGKVYRAHRVVYEATKGPIPKGMVIDHLCGNRYCVNPDHLEPVTHSENLKRGGYAHASQS